MTSRGRIARLCLRSSQAGAVLLLLAPLGYRIGLVGLLPAFASLALGLLVCLLALVVASVTWAVSRRRPEVVGPTRTAVLVSVLVLVVPACVLAQLLACQKVLCGGFQIVVLTV